MLEDTVGFRLPTSRLTTVVTSQTYAVTSVFHNQNDLATYLAICWPFILCAFFFTRRAGWLALATLRPSSGAAAFVRTGSRSSLLAVGRRIARRRWSCSGASAPAWPRAAARSSSPWSPWRSCSAPATCSSTTRSRACCANSASRRSPARPRPTRARGRLRQDLTSRGLQIAGHSLLLGAGPGQAEVIIGSGAEALGIANLHNWWLETYADGGLPGFALHLLFFVFLLIALWPIAKSDPDPFVRYLASGCALALVGLVIGALGPSSVVSFAPMWALYGLGLAVVSWARIAEARRAAPAASQRTGEEDAR